MDRVTDTAADLQWLTSTEDGVTGFDATGWQDYTWVLHSMYENSSLAGLGTHDDIHRQRLDAGTIAPLIIGDVNLDEGTTVTGAALGWIVNPGAPWVRVTWSAYLARFPDFVPNRSVPPCFRWFPSGSQPVAIEPPPEGSLDEDSLDALVRLLAGHEQARGAGEVFAFYASLPSGDFDQVHLWRGSVEEIPSLIEENGGPYGFSPSNIWPVDRSWFAWTDYDLSGTKVSGPVDLVEAIRSDDYLETVEWSPVEASSI